MLRDVELVQNDKVAAGAALIRDSVTKRVTRPHPITIRIVPALSTKRASEPPATGTYVHEPGEIGESVKSAAGACACTGANAAAQAIAANAILFTCTPITC